MSNEYFVDGRVAVEKIVMDIKYRKLNRTGIERLVSDPVVRSAFIGTSYDNKKPKNEWNKSYLDKLSYVMVGKGINPDYLFYLDEVAEYVSKARPFSKAKYSLIVLVVIAGIILFTCLLNGGGK
ncbi:MAG: hypothetical protein LBR26_09400 [Prevotella sp.]|nr:hypothetical protein [Prevotella sp.]